MSNHSLGHDAEKQAATWLQSRGYKIVELNWRNRYCEIDIVASKKKVAYFVEVKSRRSTAWGRGIDYITAKKLAQMKFAAEMWAAQNSWPNNICLAVISVDAGAFSFVEILD